jgi:hypothetical protein
MGGLSVWFPDDVARALRAAGVAGQEAQKQELAVMGGADVVLDAYWQGYQAALRTIGAAFGVEVEDRDRPTLALPPTRPAHLGATRIVIAVPRQPLDVEEESHGD